MHRCVAEGDLVTAREIQLRMIPVNTAVTATFGIAGLKAAMQMRGYYGGLPRPPLLPLSDADTGKLRTILISGGLLE
jgi:4-hydroxy-2-oxoglutarate aldolase